MPQKYFKYNEDFKHQKGASKFKGRIWQATSEVSDNQLNSFFKPVTLSLKTKYVDFAVMGMRVSTVWTLYCFCSGLQGIQSLEHYTPQIKKIISLRNVQTNIQRKWTLKKLKHLPKHKKKQYENYTHYPTIIK